MDIGLGKVIEMLEERFGRPSVTGLLFLLYLAIAVFCLHAIATMLVVPLWEFISKYVTGPEITVTTVFYTTAFIAAAVILFPLVYAYLSKRKVPQAIVDTLAELRSRAIHEVLNARVSTDDELAAWHNIEQTWNNEVASILERHFPRAEVLGFKRLGVIQQVAFPHSFNNDHAFKLMMFAKRLSILEDIIRRHSNN